MKINISIKIDYNLYIMSFKFRCFMKQFFHNVPKIALGLCFDMGAQLTHMRLGFSTNIENMYVHPYHLQVSTSYIQYFH